LTDICAEIKKTGPWLTRDRQRLRNTIELALAEASSAPGFDVNSINVEIDPVNLM
jgi:hypothetical protein